MKTIVAVEQTQAALDELYGEISVRRGERVPDELLELLRFIDEKVLVTSRTLALSVDEQMASCEWMKSVK